MKRLWVLALCVIALGSCHRPPTALPAVCSKGWPYDTVDVNGNAKILRCGPAPLDTARAP